jgi:hypothetical protein
MGVKNLLRLVSVGGVPTYVNNPVEELSGMHIKSKKEYKYNSEMFPIEVTTTNFETGEVYTTYFEYKVIDPQEVK